MGCGGKVKMRRHMEMRVRVNWQGDAGEESGCEVGLRIRWFVSVAWMRLDGS